MQNILREIQIFLWWSLSSLLRASTFSLCPHMVEGARDPHGSSFIKHWSHDEGSSVMTLAPPKDVIT